jgi:anti-sigma regulatory factor (Ser/Thr protein kinase)
MANPVRDNRCGLRSATIVNGALELVLNNTLAAIEDGSTCMLDFLDRLALDESTQNRLQVVFEELVSNIIRHGFFEHSGQSIHVRIDCGPGMVNFIFEDDGTPFNPLDAPAPCSYTTIESAKVGGLGISLVSKYSSQLHYERPPQIVGANGFSPQNRLVVTVAIPV